MTVGFLGEGLGGLVHVNTTNRMVVQRKEVERVPNQLRMVITGTGCMMLQVHSMHRVLSIVALDLLVNDCQPFLGSKIWAKLHQRQITNKKVTLIIGEHVGPIIKDSGEEEGSGIHDRAT